MNKGAYGFQVFRVNEKLVNGPDYDFALGRLLADPNQRNIVLLPASGRPELAENATIQIVPKSDNSGPDYPNFSEWAEMRKLACDRGFVSKESYKETLGWDWRELRQSAAFIPRTASVVCAIGSCIHGAMIFSIRYERPKCPETLSPLRRILYVDYLEVAPWNRIRERQDWIAAGQFQMVGTQLIVYAIKMSVLAGCRGIVGLHSLTSSEPYYRLGLGMWEGELEYDVEDNNKYRYFEFSENRIERLIVSVTSKLSKSAAEA